ARAGVEPLIFRMSDLEQNKVVTPRAKTDGGQADGPSSAATSAGPPMPANGTADSATRRLWTFIRSERKGILLRGNRLRPLRGGLTAFFGGLVAFLLMSVEAQFRWGVPLG